MKNGKKPTVAQKKLMVKWKLDPTMWMVSKDTSTEMLVVHRHFDHVKKIIPKGGAPRSESESIACRGQAHHRKR